MQGRRVLRREVIADGEVKRGEPAGGVEPPPAPRKRGRGHRGARVADAQEDRDQEVVGEGADHIGVMADAGSAGVAAAPLEIVISDVVTGIHRLDYYYH